MSFLIKLRKWAYYASGFHKYGLRHDDVLSEFNPEVVEAIRRLPQNLKDERVFRIIRAMQLSLEHSILPQEEWTKFEDDERYLQPYIDEILEEQREKKCWENL